MTASSVFWSREMFRHFVLYLMYTQNVRSSQWLIWCVVHTFFGVVCLHPKGWMWLKAAGAKIIEKKTPEIEEKKDFPCAVLSAN